MQQNFQSWITKGEVESYCKLSIHKDAIEKSQNFEIDFFAIKIDRTGKLHWSTNESKLKKSSPITGLPKGGYFSAGFGPFRRIGTQESREFPALDGANLEAHISLFESSYTLTSAKNWLMDLQFRHLSSIHAKTKSVTQNVQDDKSIWLEEIISLINTVLPDDVHIEEITPSGVYYKNKQDQSIELGEMSDGYQSVFSLTVEIIRQITSRFEVKYMNQFDNFSQFIRQVSGVVLIDEIDIHLHPRWQSKIGNWFKEHFPNLQFIVTTHSPIICQSAENGSIWKIERSTDSQSAIRIVGQDFKRMVFGNILEAVGTDSFGTENVWRSEESKQKLNRLAQLNIKQRKGIASDDELREREELQSILPTADN